MAENCFHKALLRLCLQVASIAMDEDDVAGVAQEPNSTDEGKSWSDIIPESDRKKIEEEEEQKKQLELYLPPRNRKTVKKVLPFFPFVYRFSNESF